MGKKTVLKRILKNTKKNIVRNKWLSVATVFVVFLTFIIASSIIALAVLSKKTVTTFEKKAQIIVFFQNDTEEDVIDTVKQSIENTDLTEGIEYVSQEEALEIYRSDFEDDPTLVDSITADALPPSLNVRVSKIEDMDEVLEKINEIKDGNEAIEDVMYFQDVIDTLEDLSRIINVGGIGVVIVLSLISISLILITISFNIDSHHQEIETMKLIGSTASYIRVPFLLEGAFYGFVGSLIASTIIFIVWYGMIAIIKDSDIYYFISQTFSEIGAPYLKQIDVVFMIKVLLAEITAGTLIGFASSSLAIWRHLK